MMDLGVMGMKAVEGAFRSFPFNMNAYSSPPTFNSYLIISLFDSNRFIVGPLDRRPSLECRR